MATAIYPSFKLGKGAIRSGISRTVDIPSHDLLAVASRDGIVRVINDTGNSEGSKHERIFDKHEGEPMLGQGLVHLAEDIMCSMDASGKIITWSAAWGYVLGTIELRTYFSLSYTGVFLKLSDTKLAIENGTNTIIILSHEQGRNLRVVDNLKILDYSDSPDIVDVASHNEHLVVLDRKGNVSVWNYETKTLLNEFRGDAGAGKVGINDWFIAVIYSGLGIFYMNGGEYAEVMRLDLKSSKKVNEINFISPNHLMTSSSEAAIIVSLISGEVTDQVELKSRNNKNLKTCSSSVMLDGRICIGSSDGHIAFYEPPENIRAEIRRFSDEIHDESSKTDFSRGSDSTLKNSNYKDRTEEESNEIYQMKEELRFILEGNNEEQNRKNVEIQNLKEEQEGLKLRMKEDQEFLVKRKDKQHSSLRVEHESLKNRMLEMEETQKNSNEKIKELAAEIGFLKDVISGLLRSKSSK